MANILKFLTSNKNNLFESDVHWNNVQLLLRLDANTDAKGLPQYKDYSRYQYQVRTFKGSHSDSAIDFYTNQNNTDNIPVIPNSEFINIDSFIYINNYLNRLLRIGEINSNQNIADSKLYPTYLEVMQSGNSEFDFSNKDWTVEFSFYADELNYSWGKSIQVIWSIDAPLIISVITLSRILSGDNFNTDLTTGFGCILIGKDLYFQANNTSYKLNTNELEKLKWYHITIQRYNNELISFINGVKVNSYPFTSDLTYTIQPKADTFRKRLLIGTDTRSSAFNYNTAIDICFSGGLSNFRFTNSIARYKSEFYSLNLPHILHQNQNKIDAEYNNVLFNYPLNYDLFDYSKNLCYLTNKKLLYSTLLDYNLGFVYLDGVTNYTTELNNNSLGDSWTLEFYLSPYKNGTPDSKTFNNFLDWIEGTYLLSEYTNDESFHESYTLLKLTTEDKKVLEVNFCIHADYVLAGNYGCYFALKLSSNGNDYITIPSESNIDLNIGAEPYILPSDEIKFASLFNYSKSQIAEYTAKFKSAYSEPNTHFAITKQNNTYTFYIDGEVNKVIVVNTPLYESSTGYKLSFNDTYLNPLFAKELGTNELVRLGLGIKGIRLTKAIRYSNGGINDFTQIHSLQPLPSEANKLVPPKARVLAILRKNNDLSTAANEVEWFIYFSTSVKGLTLSKFTLTQLDGVSGATLVSLTKTNDFEYIVKANTGTGNGKLTLNFIDDKTLTYKEGNTLISNFIGELSFEGETYTINKSNPVPILYSGTNPYVNGEFKVRLQFNSPISHTNPENIGVVNAKINGFKLFDAVTQTYEFTVIPTVEGIITIQALEGTGTTSARLKSVKSLPLTRVFNDSFVILQTPLNITTQLRDYSPSRLLLNEVIPNNTVFSNTLFPLGETSSLFVNPLLEQSGLKYENYNALYTTFDSNQTTDWTIEFYLRINTSNDKTSHIFSIENGSLGICILAKNGKLVIQRTLQHTAPLFTALDINEVPNGYINWNDTTKSQLEKYPHFAITKQSNTFRIYRNGIRVAIFTSNNPIDITKGKLYIGYYQNYVNHESFYLSNLRITYGKALYTSFNVNINPLPYNIPININEATEILNYISIYSNGNQPNIATLNNKIILSFTSIIDLLYTPEVKIIYGTGIADFKLADVIKVSNYINTNNYLASVIVDNNFIDGKVNFEIKVKNQPGILERIFSNTTNNSEVFIDNNALIPNIYTLENNNTNQTIKAFIEFNKNVINFTNTSLTTTNCTISNILEYSKSKYEFDITALSTGEFKVKLDANKVLDVTNSFNSVSNELVRSAIVPLYIPDNYFNNVILLIQPNNNDLDIEDQSLFSNSNTIEKVNAQISNVTSPSSLNKSIYFNGIDSSLNFFLTHSLSANEDFTIEFFLCINSSDSISLSPPKALPASQVSTNSFRANWIKNNNSESYVLDIATDSTFSNFVSNYKNINVGNSNSLSITSNNKTINSVTDLQTKFVNSKGFVSNWRHSNASKLFGYKIDIATDSNFTNTLYKYKNKFTPLNYFKINNTLKYTSNFRTSIQDSDSNQNYNVSSNGTIINQIFGNKSSFPKLLYFRQENTIRFYDTHDYTKPIVIQDTKLFQWSHIALVNNDGYLHLYQDGKVIEKVKSVGFSDELSFGYFIGHLKGYMNGLRITKGIARYTEDEYSIPNLPYSKN